VIGQYAPSLRALTCRSAATQIVRENGWVTSGATTVMATVAIHTAVQGTSGQSRTSDPTSVPMKRAIVMPRLSVIDPSQ